MVGVWVYYYGSGATTTLIYKRSLDAGSTWGPLTLVPGTENDPNGGPRAVALTDDPATVLLTNSNGKLWRSSDSGTTWAAPTAMFSHPTGSLQGGGVIIQLSATHKQHPNRLLTAFDHSIPWNKTKPCGTSPYAAGCEYASSYWSDDGGKTWQLSKDKVPNLGKRLRRRASDMISSRSVFDSKSERKGQASCLHLKKFPGQAVNRWRKKPVRFMVLVRVGR